jgi:hypothetical protein
MQKQTMSVALTALSLFLTVSAFVAKAETQPIAGNAPAQPAQSTSVAASTVRQENKSTTLPQQTEVAPAQSATQSLEGQVSAVKTELAAPDYLDISRQDTDSAHSKHKYRAVSITLKNKQARHLEIVQAEIANALDEATIAQQEKQSSQRKKAFVGGLMRTATSFIPYGGYSSAYALAGTSQAINYASYAVENAPDGGLQITNQFVTKVTNVVVSPNQTFTFKVLVPAGTDPQLKVIFKDLETNRILEI